MIWPLIYPTHVQYNQRMEYSCGQNLISWTHPFLLVSLLHVLPSWGIPYGDLIQTLFQWPWKPNGKPSSSVNLSPRTPAHQVALASLLLSSSWIKAAGWTVSVMAACRKLVFKLGSPRCFQGHQRRVGWAKAQLSTGLLARLPWSCSSKCFRIWRF